MYDFTKQYEARILVRGRPATEYHHTDGNIYVEGRKGSEYELEFYNNSNERVCIVPAVDGLSVMDGKPAGIESDGYVVEARQTIKIPGWKLDDKEAAKFEFSSEKKSYASQSGEDTANQGVIGFMVFREEYQALNPFKIEQFYSGNSGGYAGSLRGLSSNSGHDGAICCDSLSASTASAEPEAVKSSLGTGFGEATDFQTRTVSFNKRDENNPDAVLVIYYDNLRGLEKRGIQVRTRKSNKVPDPFPNYSNTSGCKPPVGWRG